MTRAKAALIGGFALTCVVLVVTLFESPEIVARTNRLPAPQVTALASLTHRGEYCQSGETLPRSTSSIRIWMFEVVGHRVQVSIYAGKTKITGGTHRSGWAGSTVTIPLTPIPRSTMHNVTVCALIQTGKETVFLEGGPASSGVFPGAELLQQPKSAVWIEYLQPGKRSWISLAGGIVHRLGLGRSPGGTWIAFMVLVLMGAITALVSYLVVREAR
jgi:hypothetical protein